jgi:predicted RNase H-like HicB family nuclease
MENKPTSTNPADYEILIRKRAGNDYASYCPQLNIMFKGEEHEEVHQKLKDYIENHINSLAEETENQNSGGDE